MHMESLFKFIPIFPIISFLIIALLNRKLKVSVVTTLGSSSILLSFIFSLLAFIQVAQTQKGIDLHLFEWIHSGKFSASLAFLIDQLSSVFMLVITGVGFLIHIFSAGYMHHDDGIRRFFAYLNLFIAFMLFLVMGNNLLVMFIGWEGVGFCSFMLIGFWYKEKANNDAAKKAFIMNRIGDLGFLIAMCLTIYYFGTLDYKTLFQAGYIASMPVPDSTLTWITVCLFIGAIGKSAQIPLYTWLPDAMAGPTPVSALIHAATMVTAGIYMLARTNILFSLTPLTMEIVSIVGIATALLGASIGLLQNDIKKVLAYSTVSQLGLMFVALGVGAYSAAVFHVVTHAFFKALLFLGSGSVIHAMSGEQDIRKMGGLKAHLPTTHKTFLIGTLAISGIPPLAGFFSKDQILSAAFEHHTWLFALGLLVSMMTAFYMFRLYFLTFHGSFRGTQEQAHHLHESPLNMTFPLMVLAVLAIVAGFFGVPHVIGEHIGLDNSFQDFLAPVLGKSHSHLSAGTEWALMGFTTAIIIGMILWAKNLFVDKGILPASDAEMKGLKKTIYHKYYIDEFYNKVITQPLDKLSAFTQTSIDRKVVDGLVNNSGKGTQWLGQVFRKLQFGNTGYYALAFVIALICMFLLFI